MDSRRGRSYFFSNNCNLRLSIGLEWHAPRIYYLYFQNRYPLYIYIFVLKPLSPLFLNLGQFLSFSLIGNEFDYAFVFWLFLGIKS